MSAARFDSCTFLATASRGTEGLLADELVALGYADARVVPGGVVFQTSLAQGMRACLWSRIAQRVLLLLGRRTVADQHELYNATRSLPLADWFSPERTFAVYARTNDHPTLRHSKFVALKVKDAIVDDVRRRFGERPNIDPIDPVYAVTVHVFGLEVRFYLDLAARPLNQRGYRLRDVDAPAKETLAAALLQYSGWRPPIPMHDPTCGSGTIAIEAGLIATNTAPGLRRSFGFERWPVPEPILEAWRQMRDDAQAAVRPYRGVIVASDTDREAVDATRANIAAAGLADVVIARNADARKVEPLLGGGMFVCNPPYGERIGGDDDEIETLYDALASRFATCPDNPLAILGLRDRLEPHFGAADRTLHVLNGKLRCEFSVWS